MTTTVCGIPYHRYPVRSGAQYTAAVTGAISAADGDVGDLILCGCVRGIPYQPYAARSFVPDALVPTTGPTGP
jgi:hypothetical protein